MAVEITIPKLGSTMTSAVVSTWYKKQGETVAEGEPVVAVETDKITNDVLSPVNGVLTRILVPEGEERSIGTPIGLIEA